MTNPTTNDSPLVMARFKTGHNSPSNLPRFTRAATIEELMMEVMKSLPVDLVYMMTPDKDGRGYGIREVGVITVDIVPVEHVATAQEVTTSQEPGSPAAPTPLVKEEAPAPVRQSFAFESVEDRGFKFDTPKSQAELLKERGLEQPKAEAPGRKRRAKKAKAVVPARPISDDPNDNSWMQGLPTPPKSKGHVSVTGIRTATAAEAAAASQVGKRY